MRFQDVANSEGKRNALVAAVLFCLCLPYALAINRTASRGLILAHAGIIAMMAPVFITALAKWRNCLVVGAGTPPRLSRRLGLECVAISAAVVVSVAVLWMVSDRTLGQLLPIHLWTAVLPVYVGFLFTTCIQLLSRPKPVIQPPEGYQTKIQAMLRGERFVLEVADVEVFSSENHETVAYVGDREFMCDVSLNRLSERLDPKLFVRSHRSHLVNLAKVTSLNSEGTEVKMASGRLAMVSKRNRGQLRRALQALST